MHDEKEGMEFSLFSFVFRILLQSYELSGLLLSFSLGNSSLSMEWKQL